MALDDSSCWSLFNAYIDLVLDTKLEYRKQDAVKGCFAVPRACVQASPEGFVERKRVQLADLAASLKGRTLSTLCTLFFEITGTVFGIGEHASIQEKIESEGFLKGTISSWT